MPEVEETGRSGNVTGDSRLEAVFKLVQILAILASGLWALYQFLSFQRQANSLSYKQQELATKQSELNLHTQEAAEKATLAQTELAAQQAQFTLQTQQSQRDQRNKELEYAVEAKRLENESSKVSLMSKTTYRVSRASVLVAHELTGGLYEVILKPGIKNAAESAFEVSLIIVDYYIGTVDPDLLSSPVQHASSDDPIRGAPLRQLVTDPPGRWHMRRPDGAIRWHQVGTSASAYSEAAGQIDRFDPTFEEDLLTGAASFDQFGTGTWKSGEEIEFEPRFIVAANPTDYVAFSVHIVINRGRRDEDHWWFAEYEPLAVVLKNGPH